MNRRNRIIAIASVAAVIVAGGAGMAIAGNSGEDSKENEVAITGPALQKAESAALAHTGQGSVSGTEVGDEDSYYEVEVTLDDGSEADVQLDRGFNVVSQEADDGSEVGDTN